MTHLVKIHDKEVAWHGVVERKPKNQYLVQDILIYPQTVTGVTVDADTEAYPQWLIENRDLINKMRLQGHSHVNMGVTPSSTDEQYYAELSAQVSDFYIFIILNKSGTSYTRIYDFESGIEYESVPIKILSKVRLEVEKEVKKYVKNKTYPSTVGTYFYNPNKSQIETRVQQTNIQVPKEEEEPILNNEQKGDIYKHARDWYNLADDETDELIKEYAESSMTEHMNEIEYLDYILGGYYEDERYPR